MPRMSEIFDYDRLTSIARKLGDVLYRRYMGGKKFKVSHDTKKI